MRSQSTHSSKENDRNLASIKSERTESPTVTETLKKTLAEEYILQLKTQNCHWNVEGPLFFSLHKLFEEQYGQIAEFVDRAAEVLRALKTRAPVLLKNLKSFLLFKNSPRKKSTVRK